METTPNLALPYITSAQAQKHVTHNEAIRALDAVVQLSVLDRDLTTPPTTPGEGDRYIVAAGASGSWAAHAGHVAAWQDGTWAFHAPKEGWIVWVADEDRLAAWDGSAWRDAISGSLNLVPRVGINATADSTSRLTVASPSTLLSHDGAGHQVKINKAASGSTASLLYQTGWSGRAEMGLIGDDDFHLKVSPDGSAWMEAVVVDGDTGRTGLGTVPGQARVHCRVAAADAGRAFLMTGKGITGTDDAAHGAVFVLGHNTAGNRQFVLANSESGLGIRVIGTSLDGYNFFTGGRQNMTLGTADPNGTDVTAMRNLYAIGHFRANQWARVGTYAVGTLPSATTAGAGAIIHVSDEIGGAVLAFSDGTAWRRVTDRVVVS